MSEGQWGYVPPQPVAPPPQPKSKARGWIIAAAIALGIGCILFCAIGYSCKACMSFGQTERIKQIVFALRQAVPNHPRAAEYEADLQALERLNETDDVGFMPFGILQNRFQDASLDGQLTNDEIDHVFLLIKDINAGGGNVNMQAYPQGR